MTSQFTSFTVDGMDNLSMEFQDFHASSDNQLPPSNLDEATAIDHFWAAMVSQVGD